MCLGTSVAAHFGIKGRSIWRGLRNGTFAMLNSDHCPFPFDDAETGKKTCILKEYPVGRFKHIPKGIPGIETRLPLAFSAPGGMIPGVSDADLVVWFPDGTMGNVALTNVMLHHGDGDYTPFEGKTVNNWQRYTILRGGVIWEREGGGIACEKNHGEFLKRQRSTLNGRWDTVEEDGPFDLEKL
ncbi:hypothetical protein F5Y18DRAFT_431278 [Xylariaceae sp. FL1019]|nr:hypothetical protein F5Y18DRAFT_431278 [Xylariaceae sp. FL1019]